MNKLCKTVVVVWGRYSSQLNVATLANVIGVAFVLQALTWRHLVNQTVITITYRYLTNKYLTKRGDDLARDTLNSASISNIDSPTCTSFGKVS